MTHPIGTFLFRIIPFFCSLSLLLQACDSTDRKDSVLIFLGEALGSSVPPAVLHIMDSLSITYTIRHEEEAVIEQQLKNYSALLLLDSTWHPSYFQENHLTRYLEAGGTIFTFPGTIPAISQDGVFILRNSHLSSGGFAELWKTASSRALPDYRKAVTEWVPADNRFERSILAVNLNEPMEVDVLDENRVIWIERHGHVKIYDLRTRKWELVKKLEVHDEFNEGLIGLAVDPAFDRNHWIYLLHGIVDDSVMQLSRFTLRDNRFVEEETKNILQIPVQRETCCHLAGSLEFGPDGLIYIAIGDNSSPFQSDGYAPIDERPGRHPFDAQNSSGDTNDLRGKILRIRLEADGTYTIPEGNLFAPGTEKTRQEIYAMGLRNPFRISIDARRNWLVWGDIGPDANEASPARGPAGYDELNITARPGNFGWPWFVGNNFAYRDYNFHTRESGDYFNPDMPVNDSPRNRGLDTLPPATPAVIYYPYEASEKFPWLGSGGRNAMAGPVYYPLKSHDPAVSMPDWMTGKLLFYEWMRNFFFLLTVDNEMNVAKYEPFLSHLEFIRPTDVVTGRDGSLYMLEYGQQWYSQNEDARLSRIIFRRDNRPPVLALNLSETSGALPFKILADASDSYDPDGEELLFNWEMMGDTYPEKGATRTFTIEEPGVHELKLEATDPNGNRSSYFAIITAGNSQPEIDITLSGTDSTFRYGEEISYSITIRDEEDGSSDDSELPGKVSVNFEYLPRGVESSELQAAGINSSKTVLEENNCMACHAPDREVYGPSYLAIAGRYSASDREQLAEKVIRGGSGNWGEKVMNPHPQLRMQTALQIVDYILSMEDVQTVVELPLKGTLRFDRHDPEDPTGRYVLRVAYTDAGADGVPRQTVKEIRYLLPEDRD